MMKNNIIDIAKRFYDSEKEYSLKLLDTGHINETYIVLSDNVPVLVVQKINKNVFKRPEYVMENICRITDHIRLKLEECGDDVETKALRFMSVDGKYYVVDANGEYWRAYHYVDGNCFQSCDSAELFERVGFAFGKFQQQLSDFDASVLHETISDFHNTAVRYEAFERAVDADVASRVKEVCGEIEFLRKRKQDCSYIVDGIADGKFPLRVTHNDTKLNNIILDKETGDGLCVIDLDTVMPGSMLYDFGDAIRFGASSAAEDETDLSLVYVKTDMFESFVKGFIEGLDGSATKDEIMAFPQAAKIITLETGMRFLTDYLSGDTYFRIDHKTHNLERARNQFKLVESIEKHIEELNDIVKRYI